MSVMGPLSLRLGRAARWRDRALRGRGPAERIMAGAVGSEPPGCLPQYVPLLWHCCLQHQASSIAEPQRGSWRKSGCSAGTQCACLRVTVHTNGARQDGGGCSRACQHRNLGNCGPCAHGASRESSPSRRARDHRPQGWTLAIHFAETLHTLSFSGD
ncbi:hypothetical protein BU26DRAFT_351474 [Trematosphaeria pertusa]|uniref:Uncharacterized protein n=1 Tax=Trematosphaeria pertusa TaxID=390896 RepID=A0A6A6IAQ7_9PLEO|nr:uncharacterized protein BU26DRAFT_351474 [Trematosphaeria pertusa]KAF2247664.1 hypothetical protein BU26DRAFT_351474 [Trematosphaeria pertusa]